VTLTLAGSVFAQNYPNRPIRLLVGYPAGGAVDITARLTGQHLSAALGQPVVIDNRPGAGATLSATLLRSAGADGYTLMMGANGEMAISPNLRPNLGYEPLRDFATVSRVGSTQLVLVVPAGLPARSVSDLIGLAKAKPGSINFASSGIGSTAHLAGELFKEMAGIDIVHVPYKGAPPAITDLIAARAQMLITAYSTVASHVKAGRLRALGVTGLRRLRTSPEVPTIGETLPGYEVTSWYGLFAPALTPRPIIDRLHKAIAELVKKPIVVEELVALGIEPEADTPEEFRVLVRSEIAKWGRIVKRAGVRVE
jgi:tripartite-type tricarboxylate transporter receptor subunit TctC